MIIIGHFFHLTCSEGDEGSLVELRQVAVDAAKTDKLEKKEGVAGQAAKKEPGRLITPQLDTTSVGPRVSLSSVPLQLF
jgi:hypothetical protein